MKMLIACASAMIFVIASAGCEKTTTNGTGGKKLTIVKPANQTLKRGEVNEIALNISRENFSSAVKVKFENLPKGVKVVEDKPIPADQTHIVYTLHADNDADMVANHVAKVTVEGPDGMAASETFELTVKDKS